MKIGVRLIPGLSIILAAGRIRMTGKPTYQDLERRIKQFTSARIIFNGYEFIPVHQNIEDAASSVLFRY
ncbi:hypothetical protein N9219_00075 [bacterium]|nr:hypothetical protein [bacterium]